MLLKESFSSFKKTLTFALMFCLNAEMFKYLSIFFLLILSGCSKSSTPGTKRPLHLNISQDPSTFDPRKAADFSSSTLTFFLYEGLMRSTPENIYEPALAEKVEVLNKGLTYVFHLKKALWSDRSSITAYDFERSWKEILDPKFPCPNAYLFYPIVGAEEAKKGIIDKDKIGIKAIDAQTLKIDLVQPTPYFLELTAFCTFFPYKELESSLPLYSGPYRLKEYKTKDHIDLEKNPTYWGNSRVKLDQIRLFLVDESMTALEMFERGDIDLIGSSFTTLPLDSLPMLKKQHDLQSVDTAGTTLICFSTLSKYFKNEKLRQAFLLSIDRKDLVENLTFLNEKVATSLLPPMLQREEESHYVWITDRKKARELFREALEELQIAKEDLKIRFTYSAGGVFPQIGQAIQEQIRISLDIHLQIEQLEPKVYLDRLYKRDFDLAGSFILAQYLDPLAYLDRFKSITNLRNYPSFQNERYSSLIDLANQTRSLKEREKLLRQAEKILIESATVFPLYHFRNGFVVSKKIKNLKTFPQGTLYLEEVEIT